MNSDIFVLSDFIRLNWGKGSWIPVQTVKEFIRILKEEEIELRDLGLTYEQGVSVWKRMNDFIDKKAGTELVRNMKEK